MDLACGRGSGQVSLHVVLRFVGAPPSEAKGMSTGQYRAFLGTHCRTADISRSGTVIFEPMTRTKLSIAASAIDMLRTNTMTPGQASKIRGQLGWSATNSFGRCGRIGTFHIKRRQDEDQVPELTEQLRAALDFVLKMLDVIEPRSVQIVGCALPPVVVYSDASYEEESSKPPRLGWVIFDSFQQRPLAWTLDLDPAIVGTWLPRRQQIFAAEAMAAPAATSNIPASFRGRDVLWFVDNESACSTLIRGASTQEDVNGIAECVHVMAMALCCRLWFEWIDSGSNPSDGLSRRASNAKCLETLPGWQRSRHGQRQRPQRQKSWRRLLRSWVNEHWALGVRWGQFLYKAHRCRTAC